jgi:putative ABC transport system permease protein
MTTRSHPPRLARAMVTCLLRGEMREIVLGDLDEEFTTSLEAGTTRSRAGRRYWRQALASVAARSSREPRDVIDPSLFQEPALRRRSLMHLWFRDVRYAFRLLRRQPAFSSIAVLTLAIGIGATTAVFTVVYGVLLRPLPYRDPSRLMMLFYGHHGEVSPWLSPLNLRGYVAQSDVFAGTAAIAPITANMTGTGDPERLQGARVSWNYFSVLGARMALGRPFTEADGQGDGRRIVLSYRLWRRRFGSRQDVVNSTTTFDGHIVTVVGVASPDVQFPATAEFWQLLIFTPKDLAPEARGAQWVHVLARLKDDESPQVATTALETIARRLGMAFPKTENDATVMVIPLQDRIVGDSRPTLVLLLGAVTLVMIIACANVASLLLARAKGRGREMSVRAAVGASRGQLVGQMLLESLVLGFLGTIGGVGLAVLPVRALVLLSPSSIPRLSEVSVDIHVLAFAAGAAVVTSLVFGLIPALSASGWPRGGRFALERGAIGAASTRLRRVLVAAELALAVMLLAGAGLLIRSYVQLQHVTPGFDPAGVVTFSLSLPAAKYSDPAAPAAFVTRLLSRVQGEPGVESAAAAMGLPFTSDLDTLTGFRREGQPEPDSASMPSASLRIITADYFKTMRIPIRRGRQFTTGDTAASPEVAIINEQAAQRFFAGVNPIGEQIRVSAELARQARNGPKTIVGVVGNVKYHGLDAETPAEIYLPYDQQPVEAFTVAVRSSGDVMTLVPTLRREVASLDPLLPLANINALGDLVDASIAGRRLTLLVFLFFGAIAVVMSAIGVYGVLAYLVGQRTREIGLRLAIGALPSDVVWLFVREGAVLSLVGVAAGLAGALAAGRWIAALLFGVAPADPLTFAAAVLMLGLTAACATYFPARRAARVDPAGALRSD